MDGVAADVRDPAVCAALHDGKFGTRYTLEMLPMWSAAAAWVVVPLSGHVQASAFIDPLSLNSDLPSIPAPGGFGAAPS